MDNKFSIKFPKESMIYLAICLSGLIILLFFGLVPSQRSITRLDAKIDQTKLLIEEQQTLLPIYKELKKKAEKKVAWTLPFPARIELPRENLEELAANIKRLSRLSNVDILSLNPALSSLSGNKKYLEMEIVAKGDFYSFRKFLIDLEGIPYLERIEEIQIQQNVGGMELKVKLWILSS
jgi:hypothetical protein